MRSGLGVQSGNGGIDTAFKRAGARRALIDNLPVHGYAPATSHRGRSRSRQDKTEMKVRNSIKSLAGRHRQNRIVRRKGRIYVINKQNPRFKARQG